MKTLNYFEVGKMLGMSNLKLIKFLKDNNILFKTNNVNLPYQKFINEGLFVVHNLEIKYRDSSFVTPAVKITQKGFEFIKNLMASYSLSDLEKEVNETMFRNIAKLGIKYDRFKILIETERETNDVTYFQFLDGDFIPLVKYNKKNLVIIDKYGLQ